MIFFFHHYELPLILQQARIQQIIIETRQNANMERGNEENRNNDDATTNATANAATSTDSAEQANTTEQHSQPSAQSTTNDNNDINDHPVPAEQSMSNTDDIT
jgi:hypothetical protein